jgi:hypothetical protein
MAVRFSIAWGGLNWVLECGRQSDMESMDIEQLPDLKSFSKSMEQCSEFCVLEPEARTSLLKMVLEIAKVKIFHERTAELTRELPPATRYVREKFSELRGHLEEATNHLQKVSELAPGLLPETLRHLPPEVQVSHDAQPSLSQEESSHTHGDFERIAIMLHAAVNYARWREFLCAEAVHPRLRNKAEEKIVQEGLPSFASADRVRYIPIASIGEKSAAASHWFIGNVHLCLVEAENALGPGHKIKNERHIIARMFKVLFNDKMRSAESIRKELERQRTAGIPKL